MHQKSLLDEACAPHKRNHAARRGGLNIFARASTSVGEDVASYPFDAEALPLEPCETSHQGMWDECHIKNFGH
jgi:hypothetical protein